jgi:opine dehydrogenase
MSQGGTPGEPRLPRRLRITVSTTLPQGVATAVAAMADHEVVLHVLDGAEPAVAALVATEGSIVRPASEQAAAGAPVTRDMQAALARAELLVVIAETVAQRAVALAASSWLSRDAVVLLAPGGVLGSLEFARTLRDAGKPDVVVAETTGFMHLGGVEHGGLARVTGVKRDLPVAFFPSDGSDSAAARVRSAFPLLERADNVLITSLANTNVVVHPGAALLSAGLIETRGGGFGFYTDAFSRGAGRIVDRIDTERVVLLKALGLPAISAIEWFRRFYADQGMTGGTITEMLTTFPPFQASPAPDTLRHRYFREDVPFGLVPMASLARQVGHAALVMEAVIGLCSVVCDEDFWALGRTIGSLGLGDLSAANLLDIARRGWPEAGRIEG